MVSQINRCSISVPSNIAEGSGRSSNKEFSYFIKVALGSLFELETQLILSNEFGIIKGETLSSLVSKIIKLQKMLTKFLTSLELSLKSWINKKKIANTKDKITNTKGLVLFKQICP